MALIAMAVYSTEENKKDDCLQRTLQSLVDTVDFRKHRLMLSVNGHTQETRQMLNWYSSPCTDGPISKVIYNDGNLGTAEAINKAWKERLPGENAIKMDDDVVIHNEGWVDLMEEAVSRDSQLGIIGLKRRDCWEHTRHEDPELRSELYQLPHVPGQKWITVEKVNHVMGTCQLYSSALLDKIGYMYQPRKYGYDDVLASHRSHLAGFYNCMLVGVDIEHIDEGQTPFQGWKEKHAGECTAEMIQTFREYKGGARSIYYNPFI